MPRRPGFHTWIALLCALLLGGSSLVLGAVTGVAAHATTTKPSPIPPPARSWYVSQLSGDLEGDVAHARARGCRQARRSTPGLVVLGFGSQRRVGVTAFNGRRPTQLFHVVHIAAAFADGLAICSPPSARWVLAMAVSNSGGATPWNGAMGGALWAGAVEMVARVPRSGASVVVGGGIDMEPGWGPPAQGRAWVDAFVAHSRRVLINFGSADLCSSRELRRNRCANGWTRDDLVHVSTAAGPNVWVAPEVYDARGVMAGQWALIARRAELLGTPLRFAGVMTQQAACAGSSDPACAQFSLSSAEAIAMLRRRLGAAGAVYRGSMLPTDIGWGWHP